MMATRCRMHGADAGVGTIPFCVFGLPAVASHPLRVPFVATTFSVRYF
jgi:hypothetical protein